MSKISGYLFVSFCIISLTLSGCGAPTAEPVVQPTAVTEATVTWTPVPPTATSTLTPTPTPIPITVFDMPDMLVSVSLSIHSEVATSGEYLFVPLGSEYAKKPRLQHLLPRYGEITLQGYPSPADAIEEPAIRIFTTDGMQMRYAYHVETVQELMVGVKEEMARYPAFPNLESSALQARLLLPLDFKNGSGFRYINFELIEEKGNPIPRASVSYIYQGITSDNEFFLSLILPIDLPPLRQKAQQILLQAIANPTPQPLEFYYPEFLEALGQAADEEFVPNLALLDELVRSVEVLPK